MRTELLLGGEWVSKEEKLPVVYPYTGEVVAEVSKASEEDVYKAIEVAKEGYEKLSALTPYERYEILMRASQLLKQRAEDFAKSLVLEVGKTIREARTEVQRAIQTLIFSAEEARRIGGEVIPIDAHPNGKSKIGFYLRQPVGIVSAITPFNFPLNLSMHKVAPALACGNAVILKPSERTPLTPLMLGEVLLEAGLPPQALSILPGYGDVGKAMTTHPDVRVVSFTGSRKIGEIITRQAGIKKVVLELGSNSAIVLHKDGDLKKAVQKTVLGGYAIAGQVCISVQRVFVHEELFDQFLEELEKAVNGLKVGDPMQEDTDVGPMIGVSEVQRVQEWIDEALHEGAKLITGGVSCGDRVSSVLLPTIVSLVPPNTKLYREEAFAPVVVVNPYKEVEEAIQMVNDSEYGLQVGVFTKDIDIAWEFIRKVQAGGVLINEGPNFRADHMPYGGVKYSGIGREGPRFAIEDYTEIKMVIFDLS
ncbi:aldehyde dehydrogenase family protein [Pampinifervens florentissimum]|uniref:aldehyde dehydrogenase family protein n=1 Tax=Pampinifervens florentissimum TaxID=1632019 RepID=UPI0013B48F8B|nr:aldehyde dehydrogenase family protein [Hydrogenobacter sp. T-8]QID33284.1 aldehyde dehydrogenase family protein [Hydrogenobacter sp. T-8]